jgi:hypothetical protein
MWDWMVLVVVHIPVSCNCDLPCRLGVVASKKEKVSWARNNRVCVRLCGVMHAKAIFGFSSEDNEMWILLFNVHLIMVRNSWQKHSIGYDERLPSHARGKGPSNKRASGHKIIVKMPSQFFLYWEAAFSCTWYASSITWWNVGPKWRPHCSKKRSSMVSAGPLSRLQQTPFGRNSTDRQTMSGTVCIC